MSIPFCGFSIPEFCKEHGYSPAQYKTMRAKGLAPAETAFPGTNIRRVMPDAYAAWLKLINQPDIQMAEALRRSAAAKRYGKLSLKSPDHPTNVWARLKRKSA
jgi:hypothetical protein